MKNTKYVAAISEDVGGYFVYDDRKNYVDTRSRPHHSVRAAIKYLRYGDPNNPGRPTIDIIDADGNLRSQSYTHYRRGNRIVPLEKL